MKTSNLAALMVLTALAPFANAAAAMLEMFPQEDAGAATAGASIGANAAAARQPMLAPQASQPPQAPAGASSGAIRKRIVPQAKHSARPAVADKAAYPFFANAAFTTTVTRVSQGFGGAEIVEGETADKAVKSLTIYTPEGTRHEIHGAAGGLVYVAASLPDGSMAMQEFDPSLMPGHCGNDDRDDLNVGGNMDEENPLGSLDPQMAANITALAGAGDTVVDLMIVYDTRAAAWANSKAGGTDALANSAVVRMNAVLANSDIACVIRLVDVYLPNHAASANLSAELTNARNGAGGWSGIAARRTTVGADVVSVMIETGAPDGTTGIGYVGSSAATAFSACAVQAINSSHTMTHEIGHNFGCGHSLTMGGNSGPGSYPYASGLNFIGNSGTRYHTMMAYYFDDAYSSYTACNLFSSPLLMHDGVPIGVADVTDNARCIRNRMGTVAAFRLSAGVVVSFDAQLGTVSPATVRYLLNEAYGALPTPVRIGYRFDGWTTSAGAPVGPLDTVASVDHTLYAQWTPIGAAATVTFDAQGGSVSPASKIVYKGAAYDALPIATQSGHLFAGWHTAANGGGKKVLSSTLVTANANHTLYAKWTPISSGATVYYVDDASGSESASGTAPAAAKKTIQAAIARANAGDAILVLDGVYAPITTANKAITIQSVNGAERTIIDGGGSQRCATLATADNETSTIISGFTLRNGDAYPNNGGGAYGGTLSECVFTNNYANYGGGTAYSVLNRCRLIDNKSFNWGGGSYYGTINNSLYLRNNGHQAGGAYNGTLNNCTVINNTANYDANSSGGTRNSTVRNSVIWNNTSAGVLNNCNGGSITYTCATPLPSGAGNKNTDPLFIDSEGRLAPNSPCKNVGSNTYAPGDFDLDGNTRIRAVTVDMGAYEIPAVMSDSGTPVQYFWIDKYYSASTEAQYKARIDADGANGIPVWQSYVADLDPTDSGSKFVITGITFTNGVPYFTWSPDSPDRIYETVGGATLDDINHPLGNDSRFFRVKVSLP